MQLTHDGLYVPRHRGDANLTKGRRNASDTRLQIDGQNACPEFRTFPNLPVHGVALPRRLTDQTQSRRRRPNEAFHRRLPGIMDRLPGRIVAKPQGGTAILRLPANRVHQRLVPGGEAEENVRTHRFTLLNRHNSVHRPTPQEGVGLPAAPVGS